MKWIGGFLTNEIVEVLMFIIHSSSKSLALVSILLWSGCAATPEDSSRHVDRSSAAERLEPIRISDDGRHFVHGDPPRRFVAWGFNYTKGASGRLLEEACREDWEEVAEDFAEMRALGANAVRIHLQLGRFMRSARNPDPSALSLLARVVALAEENGLYLDVTGLGCYLRADVPEWYDALPEAQRWEVQARFWRAVAETCRESSAVLCYNLMNEPIVPGGGPAETDWLVGEFDGMHFVQRIALDLAGRDQKEVARAWVDTLVDAIRDVDDSHLITVGVIPWAFTFPGARPLFDAEHVGPRLDFTSVHVYPEADAIDEALTALRVYDLGRPLVVEEMFPIPCGIEQLEEFVDGSQDIVDGYFGHYFGWDLDDYSREPKTIKNGIASGFLRFFRRYRTKLVAAQPGDA